MTEQQLLRQAKRRLAILQHAEEVTGKIVHLRQPYHFGPRKISMYLARRHVYIKPRTPRLNGRVERSHRIDNFYNFHRPHGGLDGQTPDERLRKKNNGT